VSTKLPLSDVARRIRPAVFAELQTRIDRMTASGQELLPLHIGDTHLAPPEAARAVLRDLDPNEAALHRYGPTAGLAPLRDAAAGVLKRRLARDEVSLSHTHHASFDVDPAAEVLIGNGGTHALYCAACAVLGPGDEVILASPYWPLAPGVFTACGATPVEAPLTQRLYADPSLDPFDLLEAARTERTKAVYFISPNNPDGKVLTARQLDRIADFARAHDLWVFADEVYADVCFGTSRAGSILTREKMRERTITLHSLSKSHALAGIRVGYVVAPERVITAARRVSTHTAFNVSLAMQRAALAALSDEAFPQDATGVYREARDAVVRGLAGAPIRFHVAEGATYLFLDFSAALEAASLPDRERTLLAILERAVDRGVLLAPGDAFGVHYGSFARLCYTAVPLDRVVLGAARLCEAVDAFVRGKP